WIEDDAFRAGFHDAARRGDVAGLENVLELRWFETIGGKAVLGIVEIDILLQDARAIHFGNFWDTENRTGEKIGEVIEVAVAIFVARVLLQDDGSFLRSMNNRRRPSVGMNLGFLKPFGHEGPACLE